MSAEVVEGRFLGPNSLAHTLLRAAQFAVSPTINGTQSSAVLDEEIVAAIRNNVDIQELGLLSRVLVEKSFWDSKAGKEVGATDRLASLVKNNERLAFVLAIGNSKPTKDSPLDGIPLDNPNAMLINGFEVSEAGLKRILRMRDYIGVEGIRHSIGENQFEHPNDNDKRRFIENVVIEQITERIADDAGIDDTMPLHQLVTDILDQAKYAYEIGDGWRQNKHGMFAIEIKTKSREFFKRQRSIERSVAQLAEMPTRGVFNLGAPRPKEYALR